MQLVAASTGEIVGRVEERSLILAGGKFRFAPTGLYIEGTPTFEEWERAGELLGHIQKRIHWWIGDWLAYGERRWGEDHAQALDAGRFSEKTLANDKWVASKVPISLRKETLSFTHHALIAPLEPDDQARLLDEAENGNWSTRELHREVKKVQRSTKKDNPHRKVELHVDAIFFVEEDKVDDFRAKAKGWGSDMAVLPGVDCVDFSVERA